MKESEFRVIDGVLCKKIYRAYITVNGERIYPKNAKCFILWVPVE